jgi:hypothetical protein
VVWLLLAWALLLLLLPFPKDALSSLLVPCLTLTQARELG